MGWSYSSISANWGNEKYIGLLTQTDYRISATCWSARGVGNTFYLKLNVNFLTRKGSSVYSPQPKFRVRAGIDSETYYSPGSPGTETLYYTGSGSGTSITVYVFSIKSDGSSQGNIQDDVSIPAVATFTVTYNANNGTSASQTATKTSGTDLTIIGCPFTYDKYKFVKWNTAADGTGTDYAAGSAYTGNAALTLYAQWEKATVPLYLNVGGDVLESDGLYIRVGDDVCEVEGVYIRVGDDIIEV